MSKEMEIAEIVREQVLNGKKVTAFVVDDSAGDTPYKRGEAFIVADIKITHHLEPQEIQVISADGWAFLYEEVEFNV